MSLLDAAREYNSLFFDAQGFTTVAIISLGDQATQVNCIYTRIEETLDKMSRIPVALQTAEALFREADLPSWWGKECLVKLQDSAGEQIVYTVDRINRDRMLGRVHVTFRINQGRRLAT